MTAWRLIVPLLQVEMAVWRVIVLPLSHVDLVAAACYNPCLLEPVDVSPWATQQWTISFPVAWVAARLSFAVAWVAAATHHLEALHAKTGALKRIGVERTIVNASAHHDALHTAALKVIASAQHGSLAVHAETAALKVIGVQRTKVNASAQHAACCLQRLRELHLPLNKNRNACPMLEAAPVALHRGIFESQGS